MADFNFEESMEKYKIIKDKKEYSVAKIRALRGEDKEETRKDMIKLSNQILKARLMEN